MNTNGAYTLTAVAGGLASILIAMIAINHFTSVSDAGMWAIACMVSAPAAMAVGVAGFITLGLYVTGRREPHEPPRAAGDAGRSDITVLREDRYPG
jgi:hypothetical protein